LRLAGGETLADLVTLQGTSRQTGPRLRILHCLRAPVGGLFRHVRDLAREQAARGHAVGMVCDATATDDLTQARLLEVAPTLELGLHRLAMRREAGFADLALVRAVRRVAVETRAQVLHGHGAKGGSYARIAAWQMRRAGWPVASVYTPHGGSLHYDPGTLKGRLYMAAERMMLARTGGLIFESRYAAEVFGEKIGTARCPVRVIHNGLAPDEIRRVETDRQAAEFIFVGELRRLKGVDVLIDAMAILAPTTDARLVIAGQGPDEAAFRAQVARLSLGTRIHFAGAMPARHAFRMGRALVLPSRAESLPYVALEAAAAAVPLIATSVGGLPEIVQGTDTELVPPGDPAALAAAMRSVLERPLYAADRADRLQRTVADRFSLARMTDSILDLYLTVLAPHATGEPAHALPIR
jgi:glycosyltransferase involved in cell wall biosynthesis